MPLQISGKGSAYCHSINEDIDKPPFIVEVGMALLHHYPKPLGTYIYIYIRVLCGWTIKSKQKHFGQRPKTAAVDAVLTDIFFCRSQLLFNLVGFTRSPSFCHLGKKTTASYVKYGYCTLHPMTTATNFRARIESKIYSFPLIGCKRAKAQQLFKVTTEQFCLTHTLLTRTGMWLIDVTASSGSYVSIQLRLQCM